MRTSASVVSRGDVGRSRRPPRPVGWEAFQVEGGGERPQLLVSETSTSDGDTPAVSQHPAFSPGP